MRYHRLGEIPAKRHVQFRDADGRLLTEEVLGFEGFSGNESILYHRHNPCRVKAIGAFTPLVREEWVPDTHVHRLTDTNAIQPGGDWLSGRQLLQFNADIEVSICKPTAPRAGFYRNGEGDEVLFVHHGSGTLESVFGRLRYRPHDYVVIPRGTTYRLVPDPGEQVWLVFATPGEIETPKRYRNRYGQLLEGAPFSHRDFHAPAALPVHEDDGCEHELVVRARGGLQHFTLDYHPLDVVGWDGYVYPYTFNVEDFEPITGRIHQPPPVHQTFQGQNFVICSFCPRELDWDPNAIALPYHHSNVQSEEAIYYVDGRFGSRRGVDVGMITLHPSGLPHGPQPGLVEASLGVRRTEELAVMWDTFHPLKLTQLAREHDQPGYALSWSDAGGPRLMFEEAQLYSPVTRGDDGVVTVHLADDHPGIGDPAYRARRNQIAAAALAWTPGQPAPRIAYAEAEHDVWRTVWRELSPKHERYACRAFRDAVIALDLPRDHVPQLEEINVRLRALTGFAYVPAAGIVGLDEFYGALADREFHSTQYLRHQAAPLYTPEPDLVHEVIGHGHLLADPQLAELNRLAGEAARRAQTPEGLQLVADVFWFTIEFGVLHEAGELRAYGAGILSSYGEIEEFRSMEIRPLDFAAMASIEYDITRYQRVLFAADSMDHLVDAVGGFFAGCDDDTPTRLRAVGAPT